VAFQEEGPGFISMQGYISKIGKIIPEF
jgi:hypothetical protein